MFWAKVNRRVMELIARFSTRPSANQVTELSTYPLIGGARDIGEQMSRMS